MRARNPANIARMPPAPGVGSLFGLMGTILSAITIPIAFIALGFAIAGFTLVMTTTSETINENITNNNVTNIIIEPGNGTFGTCFPAAEGDFFNFNVAGMCLRPVNLSSTIDPLEASVAQLEIDTAANTFCCNETSFLVKELEDELIGVETVLTMTITSLTTANTNIGVLQGQMFNLLNVTIPGIQSDIAILQFQLSFINETNIQEIIEQIFFITNVSLPALQEEVDALEIEIIAINAEIFTINNVSLPLIQAEVDELLATLAAVNASLPDLEAQILAAVNASIIFLQSQIDDINAEIVVIDARLDALEAHNYTVDIIDLQGQIDALSASLSSLTITVAGLSASVTTLQGQMITANSNIATLQGQMTTANSNIATLQSQMTTAISNITSLQASLATAQSDITTLQGQFTSLSSTVTTLSGVPFVTMALSSATTAERVLTQGNGITVTDGGANGAATVAITAGSAGQVLQVNGGGTWTPTTLTEGAQGGLLPAPGTAANVLTSTGSAWVSSAPTVGYGFKGVESGTNQDILPGGGWTIINGALGAGNSFASGCVSYSAPSFVVSCTGYYEFFGYATVSGSPTGGSANMLWGPVINNGAFVSPRHVVLVQATYFGTSEPVYMQVMIHMTSGQNISMAANNQYASGNIVIAGNNGNMFIHLVALG